MNERIRELAEQARKYARDYVTECKHYGHYMEHNEYELRFEEKFAELIVRECICLVLNGKYDEEKYNPNNDFDRGHNRALDNAAEGFKQHFGVEE